jgi:hypothetical protein
VTQTEAKRILLAARAGSRDGLDPDVAQALALAERDPSLRDWLAQQQAFHSAVGRELRALPVPTGLKARILTQDRVVIVPIWQRRTWLLAAACLVLSLALAALWFPRPAEDLSFAGFRSRMTGFAMREYRMDIETNNPAQIRRFLSESGAPAKFELPPGLRQAPVLGGAKLTWQNSPVAMVCFGKSKEKMLFMFVVERAALRSGPIPGPAPSLASIKGLSTASWTVGSKVFLLASEDEALLRQSAQLPNDA